MSAEPLPTGAQAPGQQAAAPLSPLLSRRRDLIELDGETWQIKDGNVQGEFSLINAAGERLRLVGVRRAADLFGLDTDDVRRWIAAGRIVAVDLDGVVFVRVQLSDTGQLTLFGR